MKYFDIEIDEDNEAHLMRHGITVAEVVQVLRNDPAVRRNRRNRAAGYIATGATDGDAASERLRLRGRPGPSSHSLGALMVHKTAEETAAAAAELYAAKVEPDNEGELVDLAPTGHLSTVVSVRLSERDVDVIERAAADAGMKLSDFLRQAALAAATDRGRVSREEVTRTVTRVQS